MNLVNRLTDLGLAASVPLENLTGATFIVMRPYSVSVVGLILLLSVDEAVVLILGVFHADRVRLDALGLVGIVGIKLDFRVASSRFGDQSLR